MRWKNGVIKYHFVDGDLPLSDECKTEFKSAMKNWTSKTNNKITFEEVSPSAWNKFCAGLFQYEYVKIMNAKLSPGVLG